MIDTLQEPLAEAYEKASPLWGWGRNRSRFVTMRYPPLARLWRIGAGRYRLGCHGRWSAMLDGQHLGAPPLGVGRYRQLIPISRASK
jgi:hypothetical protein